MLLDLTFIHIRYTQVIHGHLLTSPFGCLDDEPAALAMHRHLAATDLAEEEDGFSPSLAECQIELVRAHLLFQSLAQRILGRKEAVGGYETTDSLVRTEVVVMRDEVGEMLSGTREILRLHPFPEFPSDRGPEALAFAERLRMVCAGNHVLNALAHEEFLKLGLSAPGKVLPALVGQDLFGLAEARDTFEECLDDDVLLLMQVQSEAHDVAAVVVHEHGQVDALAVTPEQEAGDVALPELPRAGAFEAAGRLGTPSWPLRGSGKWWNAVGVQGLSDTACADADAAEAQERVTHLSQSEVRVFPLGLEDRVLRGPWE